MAPTTTRLAGRIRIPRSPDFYGAAWALDDSGRQLLRVEPAWMALAVGAGGVWVGGAQPASPRHSLLVDRIDPRSGRLVGAFTLAGNTEGLLAAGHGSLWLATFGGGELLRLDPSRR